MTYDVGYPGPGLIKTHKCDRLNLILTTPLDKLDLQQKKDGGIHNINVKNNNTAQLYSGSVC